MIKIVVDAMGGDYAPASNIGGALQALEKRTDIEITLVGRQPEIEALLEGKEYDRDRLHILHAEEVITTDEEPAFAMKKKKDSSLTKGMKLLRQGEADAFVSAGSTGAILIGGQVVAGRIKGVKRAPLAVVIPVVDGVALLVDGGANVDIRPESLVQFAIMGSLYAEYAMKVKNPRVGLVNIGTEREKGNQLVREAYGMLENCPDINFLGNVEAREVTLHGADVYVCEAFVGNVILKMLEGTATALFTGVKQAMNTNLRSKLGGLLVKPYLKNLVKSFDASEYGGAPMLGLNGLVVKAHGNSQEKQICTAILQCVGFRENDLKEKIAAAIKAQKERSGGEDQDE